jgi:hypothetical protein
MERTLGKQGASGKVTVTELLIDQGAFEPQLCLLCATALQQRGAQVERRRGKVPAGLQSLADRKRLSESGDRILATILTECGVAHQRQGGRFDTAARCRRPRAGAAFALQAGRFARSRRGGKPASLLPTGPSERLLVTAGPQRAGTASDRRPGRLLRLRRSKRLWSTKATRIGNAYGAWPVALRASASQAPFPRMHRHQVFLDGVT